MIFEVQRFWARDCNSQTSSPGDECDADRKWVIMPVLAVNEPCVRCGNVFQTGSFSINII